MYIYPARRRHFRMLYYKHGVEFLRLVWLAMGTVVAFRLTGGGELLFRQLPARDPIDVNLLGTDVVGGTLDRFPADILYVCV